MKTTSPPTPTLSPEPAPQGVPDYLSAVETAWTRLEALAKQEGGTDALKPMQQAMERLRLGIFRLVVVGEIKKGKSSFINALLKEPDLLPTASDIATSTVFKLLYGPRRCMKVFFQPDVDNGTRPEPRMITEADLHAYGTEDGNPRNRKGVDFIGVELPHPLLKEGLMIVDTPGVGGLFRAHREITWRYAPNADAICFVVDSVETVLSADEISFLRELTTKVTGRVFFIQTKTDIPGVEQARAWEKRNKTILQDELGISPDRLFYFPVSSDRKLRAESEREKDGSDPKRLGKHLERSGFLPVLRFLQLGLMKEKERHLAQDVAKVLLAACGRWRQDCSENLRIARENSREELDRIAGDIKRVRGELEQWNETVFQPALCGFERGFQDLRMEIQRRTLEEIDPDPHGPLIAEILKPLKDDKVLWQAINDGAGQIQQECLARASEAIIRIQAEFQDKGRKLLDQTGNRLKTSLPVSPAVVGADGRIPPSITLQETLDIKEYGFEEMRQFLYGGMAGSMAAGIGITLISVLVAPPAALVTGALLLAGWIGGGEAKRIADSRKRDEALRRLAELLSSSLRKAQIQARDLFEEAAIQWQRAAADALESARKEARENLHRKAEEVEDARKRTHDESTARCRQLETVQRTLAAIEKGLSPILTK